MSIWITILLSLLPQIIQFLINLINGGKKLNERQQEQMVKVIRLTRRMETLAVQAGCNPDAPVPGEDTKSEQEDIWHAAA